MLTRILLLALSLTTAGEVSAQQPRDADAGKRIVGRGYDKLSPFRAMRQSASGGLEVQIDDATWYGLESIEGIDTPSLIRRTRGLCGNKWFERITEDLVEVLTVLEKAPGESVDLQVRRLDDGKLVELADTLMTRDNRQRLLRANRSNDRRDDDRERRRPELTKRGAIADLGELQGLLDEHFSYRDLNGVDLPKLIAGATKTLEKGAPRKFDLAREVDSILRAFGDGHTRLRGASSLNRNGFLPFLVDKTNAGYVAFRADRSGFVDDEHPFLVSIDGKPLEAWLEASRARATQGSPQTIEYQAIRGLRFLAELRDALGIAQSAKVTVRLRGESGETESTHRIAPRRRPIYGDWPRDKSHRTLDGNIGYLRVPEMTSDENVLRELDDAMDGFRKTKGLIIDVRGNGGGTRAILRRLFPYFMKKNEAPHVANIAAYRLAPDSGPMPERGYLDNRWLYPASWSGWTKAQRRSIQKAKKRFRPKWKLPKGKFSDWHYFVLDRSANADAYHYDKPVVILLDRGCFSATDIFLSAFKGWRGVTMVGTPSGGGSGRSRGHRLPNSGLELRISSMASFRPNGLLYERRGVHPDLLVERAPADLIDESSDNQLQAALGRLR